MKIIKAASAGTLESGDVLVTIRPNDNELSISIDSIVLRQYGRAIKNTVEDILKNLNVTSGQITINDKGALDCTLKARLQCAIFRACEHTSPIAWQEVDQ